MLRFLLFVLLVGICGGKMSVVILITYVKKKNACQASTPLKPGHVNVLVHPIVVPMTDNFSQSHKGAKNSQFFFTPPRENSE